GSSAGCRPAHRHVRHRCRLAAVHYRALRLRRRPRDHVVRYRVLGRWLHTVDAGSLPLLGNRGRLSPDGGRSAGPAATLGLALVLALLDCLLPWFPAPWTGCWVVPAFLPGASGGDPALLSRRVCAIERHHPLSLAVSSSASRDFAQCAGAAAA